MIVILAGQCDLEAETIIARWPGASAALLTPADLSSPGWRISLADPSSAKITIAGQQVAVTQLGGVLVRTPAVYEWELLRLFPKDRAYAAAEMTAFLSYWLSAVPCPVLNRPSPLCLVGPGWRHEQWLCAAARLGIPVEPVVRGEMFVVTENTADLVTVTVVGERSMGSEDEWAREQARALARFAGVDLLQVIFRRQGKSLGFGHVTLVPSLCRMELREAVASYFEERK